MSVQINAQAFFFKEFAKETENKSKRENKY